MFIHVHLQLPAAQAQTKTLYSLFIACLHDQTKSGFFGEPDFFQPIRAF